MGAYIVLLVIIGCLVYGLGLEFYDQMIEPKRVRKALDKYYPWFENDFDVLKMLEMKLEKATELKDNQQKAINRLTEETKYLTGLDLLIVEKAIEKLKMEYVKIKVNYLETENLYNETLDLFYTNYPFAKPFLETHYNDPLTVDEIVYKRLKKHLTNK